MTGQTTVSLPAGDKPATATPSPSQGAPPAASVDDVYGEFDAIEAKEPQQPASAPKREAARQDPKPVSSAKKDYQETGSESSTEQESAKASSPESAKNASSQTEPKPVKAAELRNAYENLKREHHRLKSEFEQVKAKPADDSRLKQLQELYESERKTRQELENELKFTAYEKSPEFKDKFQKPYMQAYTLGRQKAASLKVTEQKNELDEVIRPGRQGTEADFDAIMRIDDDDVAAEKAIELFGQKAQTVLYYRERVNELHSASRAAIEDYRKNAETREREQTEARTKQEQEQQEQGRLRSELFKRNVADMEKAHPDWFTPVEGDDTSAAVIAQGKAVADSLFSGINPKTGKPYTPDGMVKFHAFVRNAVAAHGHILHKLKSAQTRITELESDIAEFKKSGSIEDTGRREAVAAGGLAGDEEFDAIESKSSHRW